MTEIMAKKLKKKQFIWTEAQTVRFIELRMTTFLQGTGAQLLKDLRPDITPDWVRDRGWGDDAWHLAILSINAQGVGGQGLRDVAGNPEQQPDEETPHTSSGCCSGFPATSDPPPATAPGTSSTPTPGSSKRKRNEVLEHIQDYTERQDKKQRELDKKEEEREDRKEKQLDQLVGILAKLAENSK
ncbi:Hypothetical predicted protein [Xyrichtys novacula]|uniref:Uncharacterized protein n=1 Tax=Xyrichtys novacula TaxID=13765 RepID=A0AAV1HQM5_XYRNO|nr:Hypothetical predicted protein [Xyrichtys novacula]